MVEARGKVGELTFHNHYTNEHFDTSEGAWKCIRNIFEKGVDENNLFIGSTGGIHGGDTTLEDMEKNWRPPSRRKKDDFLFEFTFVVIQPRACNIYYGNLEVNSKRDLFFLQRLVLDSLRELCYSQFYNAYKTWTHCCIICER